MYDQYYNRLLPYFKKIDLIATDTDSLIFAVESDDIDANLRALSDVMDFSTYDERHDLFDDSHKSELGR